MKRSPIDVSVVQSCPLPVDLSPQDAFRRVRDLPWPVLLESTARDGDLGRYSYVVADPSVRVEAIGGKVTVVDDEGRREESAPPLDVLRRILDDLTYQPLPGLPPFQSGAVGFWSYELGQTLDDTPVAPVDDLGTPLMRVGIYDWVLAWDHTEGTSWVLARCKEEGSVESQVSSLLQRLSQATPAPGSLIPSDSSQDRAPAHPVPDLPGVRSTFTKERYLSGVETVREYILAGDIFQANLSHRMEVPHAGDPFGLYCTLAKINPAPFAAYIDTGSMAVVSASPERFLKVQQDTVETRPIKGTAPRGEGEEEDRSFAAALEESEKDRAENVMIVDLLRNDLSKVCEDGTVKVPTLCAVETHPTVHHLVSTVTGHLEEGNGPTDLLAASFPGGSITGAPKLRAMEIIAELEPTQRGVYTGSIGYIGLDGTADTSIAIRTMTVKDGVAFVQAGGAVVADSDPEKEYQETLEKARGLLRALAEDEGGVDGP